MTPSKGSYLYVTDAAGQVAASSTALPTTFPLAGADLSDTPYSEVAGDWTQIECIEEIDGIDDIENETTDHRCLDASAPLVEKFPTGYLNASPINVTTTYDSAKETYFRAKRNAGSKVRLLFVLPLAENQTTSPDRWAWKTKVTKCTPMVDASGQPAKLKLEFQLVDDSGLYVAGS